MKFHVPDMSCGHCTAAIEAEIKKADAGATVTTNLSDHTVVLTTKLESAEVKATLADAGYPATLMS